jgi:FAD/FMN-containing dehydrogenase
LDDGRRISWTRSFHAEMKPWAASGEYVNFLGSDGPGSDARALALATYGHEKLARLIALKRRYDPGNLFRLNHNIPLD